MGELFYWFVALVLVVGWTFPRKYLHLVGFVGMLVMTYRAWSFGGDMPMMMLNLASALINGAMAYRMWVLGHKLS